MLAIDAEPSSQEQWRLLFGNRFEVRAVKLEEGLLTAETSPFDVVLLDLRTANDPAQVLSRLRQRQPQAAILAIAASAQAAVASLSQGATDYVLKPVANGEEAAVRVEAALARRRAGADAELLATPYSAARSALIKNFDVRYLQGLMRATRGNISEASRRSGIDRANLRRMLKHHGISPMDFGAVRPARAVTAAS
ncbi:MAG: response regulator [Myxococcaceae bacterium]